MISAHGVHAPCDYRRSHTSPLLPLTHFPAKAIVLVLGCLTTLLEPFLVSIFSLLFVEMREPEPLFSFVQCLLVSWSSWQVLSNFFVNST